MVTLDELHDLQRTLAVEQDLMVFWDAFFRLLERDGLGLAELGGAWADGRTSERLLAAAGKTLGYDAMVAEPAFCWVPAARMAHGQVKLNGTPMSMVYFEAIQMATFSFVMQGQKMGALRITLTDPTDPAKRM